MSRHSLVLTGAVAAAVVLSTIVMVSSPTGVSAQGTKPAVVDIKTKLLFDVAVMRNKKTPFVVFYYSSSECVPCKWSLLPMIEKMIRRKGDKLNMAMVDFDKVPELKEDHGVNVIPTIMVFYKGDVMDVVEGKNWSPIVGLVNRAAKLSETA
ncbi:Thioredoxin, mitochondrial [Orchesella cincta]|uniref:Thioredoxin, mitochondrial n=1 Tax=Orchesella cincta TaxID=48709 RepID=A0A1D2M8R1_ORCCI|nr:Thioredoxin, mitochondrial [Orchesella cincta]